MSTTLLWLRRDLRISDHPALNWALDNSQKVIPLFIWSPQDEGLWPDGGAARWWLHHALESLQADLKAIGLPLVIRQGATLTVIQEICQAIKANTVAWSRRYEPDARALEEKLTEQLMAYNIAVQSFNASLLHEPWTVSTKKGTPFRVFGAFWKACLKEESIHQPLPAPKASSTHKHRKLPSIALKDLKLLPKIHWDTGLQDTWQPSTAAAHKFLESFVQQPIVEYHAQRNFPAAPGTSHMSPYLHWGMLSPRQIWHSSLQNSSKTTVEVYRTQLGWREFAYHLLYHFPETTTEPLRPAFTNFPWHDDAKNLHAWQRGMTGFPIVDAGMRQLWHTGWMHNRVRMIVGSFLVKDLLIHWLEGSRWFWDTLVDADLANNTLGWQWIGGCGADAAPYFRVFNPILQGKKFDPDGAYVRQWIPELAQLPNRWIHHPWQAPEEVLASAGVKLGKNYPEPIVDHKKARIAALKAFSKIKSHLKKIKS